MTFYHKSKKETIAALDVDPQQGLDGDTVQSRLEKYGQNSLPSAKQTVTRAKILWNQFNSALMMILIVAGVISGALGEFIDMSVILLTAAFNVIIGYIQESKADQALKKLREMVTYKALVLRDGEKRLVESDQLVPGDILLLDAGDKLQADARLLDVSHMTVDESALTGESEPVQKEVAAVAERTSLGDRRCMVYRGTAVTNGRARAIVTATGADTEIGKIATLVKETKDDRTPLQQQLARMSRIIGYIVVAISVAIFIVGVFFSADPENTTLHMFETAVAIAVAAIPEGLVISLTVILAIGMRTILRRNALIRKLVAAETLGSVSVICTDKTGTITEGKMSVTRIVTAGEDREFHELTALSEEKRRAQAGVMTTLRAAVLANDGLLQNPEAREEERVFVGDTTDTAIVAAGMAVGLEKHALDMAIPRIAELPFTSERKYIATRHKTDHHSEVYIKGAGEVVLSHANKVLVDGKTKRLTNTQREQLQEAHDALTQEGLRVIGVGYKQTQSSVADLDESDINDFVFAGFIALADPLRTDVVETLKLAERAGIRTVMITGDHVKTAQSIAAQIGLPHDNSVVFDGAKLESMSDGELQKAVGRVSVFARVDPIHKIRIVRAFQKNNEVVAMTGDGVNDAPAIKGADIGVALGSGTAVAKETADMVLLDDAFSTIVAAVEGGRTIYQNIRKVVLYLLSGSFAEVVMIAGSILAGYPVAALPAQILWVNLVQDTFPTITLAFDKGERENMGDPPRKKGTSLINDEMRLMIIMKSILANVLLFIIFVYFWKTTQDIHLTRTIVFVGFGIDALFYIFSIRSLRKYVWQMNPFNNRYLLAAVALGWVMLVSAVYAPPLQFLLRTVPLEAWHWALMIGFGVANMAIIETVKAIFLVKSRKGIRYTS